MTLNELCELLETNGVPGGVVYVPNGFGQTEIRLDQYAAQLRTDGPGESEER